MKTCLLIALTLCGLISTAQNNSKKIKKINTYEEAIAFIKVNPELKGEIIEINSGTDNSETAKKIISEGAKEPVLVGDHTYKMFSTKKSYLLNAFYIYLDGTKLTIPQIDSVRQVILSRYDSGIPFADLAKEFNMDGNPDPNLKSIAEGYLVKGFSEAVKSHKKGEVFKIDVPEKNWYYVTQKTADDQESTIYSVLKIKSKG